MREELRAYYAQVLEEVDLDLALRPDVREPHVQVAAVDGANRRHEVVRQVVADVPRVAPCLVLPGLRCLMGEYIFVNQVSHFHAQSCSNRLSCASTGWRALVSRIRVLGSIEMAQPNFKQQVALISCAQGGQVFPRVNGGKRVASRQKHLLCQLQQQKPVR